MFRFLTGRARAQLENLITSPVLTSRSNDQERCDQAVVYAQCSAMDRNSIIVLFCTVVVNVDVRFGVGFNQ